MIPNEPGPPTATAAATVVLVRDGEAGLETLLLRRNKRLDFAGGLWVFPGGRVDAADRAGLADHDELGAARRAAVREAHEEAGLEVDASLLVPLAHWTPPAQTPKRFLTWFFVAPAPAGAVQIDQGEIHDHIWLPPAAALARRNARALDLLPPTWVTLETLAEHTSTAGLLAALHGRTPERFETRILAADGAGVAVWEGDAAWATGDVDAPGPRLRLWMAADNWRFERSR